MIKIFDNNDQTAIAKLNAFFQNCPFAEYNQTFSWHQIRNEKLKYYLYSEDASSNIQWICSLFEKTFDNKKILYAPRGPVLDYENKDVINLFLSEISPWLLEKKYSTLIINPIINNKHLKHIHHNYSYKLTKSNDYEKLFDSCKLALMNIDFDEEKLMMKLPSHFRRNIRKSYRNNLTFKINRNLDLDNFYQLYLETASRHNFNPHEKKYFKNILQTFKDSLICLEVWYQDIPLAMSIDLQIKNKLIYMYGVSSSSHRKLLGMYYMHWEAIKYCIQNKIPIYDFGGVFCEEEDIDSKDYGLYRFKKGFCYNGFKDIIPDIKFTFSKERAGDNKC